jgi:hypothetical protein
MTELDNNYNADLLDAMADIAYEQEQAMREAFQAHQEQWIMCELHLDHCYKDSKWQGWGYDIIQQDKLQP